MWRAGDADGGDQLDATYQFAIAGPTETQSFDECTHLGTCKTGVGDTTAPFAVVNRIGVPASHLGTHIYVQSRCGGLSEYPCPEGQHDAAGYTAVVYLYAADLLLEQAAGPTVSGVSGELATAATLAGTTDVAFTAADPGSGVYEALFSIDGNVVQRTVLDANGGRCRDVGEAGDGLPAFLYVQPCLASLSTDVGFDTTRARNGSHRLVVSVIDAAGNAAPVLDRSTAVANQLTPGTGPPNGANASSRASLSVAWKRARGERLTSPYGRAETVTGRLLAPGGSPIVGARIDVTATPAYSGGTATALAGPLTGPDGRFQLRLAGGVSSRSIRFGYRPQLDSEPPVATRTLTLSVRAGLRLRVTPHTTAVGHSIHFSGRLQGGPLPRGGKLLVLEARSRGGQWLKFNVIHSGRHGRCRASYRFKLPGPASYEFRAVSEAEADFPFAAGASNVVRVRER